MFQLGLALAAGYWLAESPIHTFVFGTGSLGGNLLARHDPNELWMRSIIVVLLAGFGAIAERSVRAERRLKEEARQLDTLGRFVERVRQASRQGPVDPPPRSPTADRPIGRPRSRGAPRSATAPADASRTWRYARTRSGSSAAC